MAASREPFGDCLFEGITDWDAHIRQTIHAAIDGIDIRKHRAAATAPRLNAYRGGPVQWEPPRMEEAA